MRVWWWSLVPVVIVLFVLLGYGLSSDPRKIPSPLIGKPFPVIEGLDLQGQAVNLGMKSSKPSVINVWASWCASCRAEHRVLLRGARRFADKIRLLGINYKDKQADARAWLDRLGDPYQWSFQDSTGKAGLELGVYGVPETFFVNTDGIIVHKIAGPLTDKSLAEGIARISR
jgi:cytochrome c biogenesis protein CcmG/thiol:disulfide interchange protein DsbE